jgi:chromosomal replication initiation ATPase DnaA
MSAAAHPDVCPDCAALEVRLAMLETAFLSQQNTIPVQIGQQRDDIIADICMVFNVTSEGLFNQERTAHLVEARFAAYWMLRRTFKWSLPHIAKIMRRKDHTTVMHGINRAIELRNTNHAYHDKTEQLVELQQQRSLRSPLEGQVI